MVDRQNDGLRSDGFLSRWARRKQDVLAGKPVAEPPQQVVRPVAAPGTPDLPQNIEVKTAVAQQNIAQAAPESIANDGSSEAPVAPAAAPTLQDAQALTAQSDFKPFMARDVSPEVKNAAMKKLFADPHYNVMDMMDVYVDDYSKPDPIPESMLREMVSTKFLRLFERDEEAVAHAPDGEDADTAATQNVAHSNPVLESSAATVASDAKLTADHAIAAQPAPTPPPSDPKPL